MAKRFLSLFVALMLLSSMFVFDASAEGTITLSLPDGYENWVYYSSNYSPYTLAGTDVVVRANVTLEEGQEIVYFLNGEEAGSADKVGDFAFTSVEGTNVMQAKVMEGDTVVATSNTIEKVFTPLVKGTTLYSHDLSEYGNKMFIYGQQTFESFVPDPAVEEPDENTQNVMKITKPQGTSINADLMRIDPNGATYGDYYTLAETGSGIIKIDYRIYAEGSGDKIDLGNIWFGCGSDTNKNNYTLYADEPSGAINGAARMRSKILPTGKWVNVSIIVDSDRNVYDVTVDNVQVTSGRSLCATHPDSDDKYLKSFVLPSPLSTNRDLVYYLKDVNIYKCTPAGITVSPVCKDAKVVAGSKVVIDTTSTYEDGTVVYYCNGVKYEDNIVVASAGTNTVYAEVLTESGNVLGTSEAVTFEAYVDEFTTAYTATGMANYERKATGVSSSIADEHEEFADDEKHGSVIKLSSYKGEEEKASANIKTNRRPFVGVEDMERLYVHSIDVYVDSLAQTNFGIAPTFYVNKVNGTARVEKWPGLFSFSPDGTLSIVTELQSNFVTASKSKKIPYNKGQWYNIKVVYDPLYGSYALMVDDVVHSVLDTSATMGDATNDCSPTLNGYNINANFLYFDMTLNSSSGDNDANVVYLDNYQAGYSKVPVGHSRIDYINNEKLVTSRNEITANDDLTVKFVAVKGEYDRVLCVATVIDDNGKLASVTTKVVTFDEDETKPVGLTLQDLPSDIADGNYTVNVMLWNADVLKPIVSKVVMP